MKPSPGEAGCGQGPTTTTPRPSKSPGITAQGSRGWRCRVHCSSVGLTDAQLVQSAPAVFSQLGQGSGRGANTPSSCRRGASSSGVMGTRCWGPHGRARTRRLSRSCSCNKLEAAAGRLRRNCSQWPVSITTSRAWRSSGCSSSPSGTTNWRPSNCPLCQAATKASCCSNHRGAASGAVAPSQQGRFKPTACSRGNSTVNKRCRRAGLTTSATGLLCKAKGTNRPSSQLGSLPGARRTKVWSERRRLRATSRLRVRWCGQRVSPS